MLVQEIGANLVLNPTNPIRIRTSQKSLALGNG